MKNISQFKWRPIYIAYGLITLSVLALFFSRLYNAGFAEWLINMDANDIVPGITLTKIALTILDVSMLVIIMLPIKDEDERVDKIRNFAIKITFRMSILFAIALGFYSLKIDRLLFAAITQVYYFLLFYLSLYHDAGIVYMNNAELEIYEKMVNKRFRVYFFIQMGIMGAATAAMIFPFHRPELIGVLAVVNAGILVLVKTVYITWKS